MVNQEQKARLLSLLREFAFAEREVTLASGKTSNFYIDCKQVTLDPEGATLVGSVLSDLVADVAPGAVAVGGLTLGADPIATATSVLSFQKGRPLFAFIVRKETKGHGTGQWLEASRRLPAGAEVVVVEDVVTTGGSALRAIERCGAAGLRVVHAVALVDRGEGGREAIESHVPLSALFHRKDFLP